MFPVPVSLRNKIVQPTQYLNIHGLNRAEVVSRLWIIAFVYVFAVIRLHGNVRYMDCAEEKQMKNVEN